MTPQAEVRSSRHDIPDALLVREAAPGAPVLVAFSSVNSNGFSFYRNLEKLPVTRIYVRDPADRWFQRGVGGDLASPETLAARLQGIFLDLKPARVVCTGASMGGYAALLFGHLLRVDAILAMSPQTIIDQRLPHTPPEDFSGHLHFDLAPLLRIKNRHRPPTHILYGSDDIVDIWNATRVSSLPGDAGYPVAGRDHLASNLVTGNGDLARALMALAEGGTVEMTTPMDRRCEVPRVRQIVDRLVRAIYLGEEGLEEEDWAARFARLEPEWAVPHDVMALLAKRRGDLAAAEKAAGRAAALAPNSITLQTNHADLLMRLKREKEAEAAYERCLLIRPKHYAALTTLGYIKARTGQTEDARRLLTTANEIRPRLRRAKELLDQIESGRLTDDGAMPQQPEDM